MCNPFGGGSKSSTTSSSAQSSNVSVTTNIDTADLANAITALGAANVAGAYATAHAQLEGAALQAAATAQAAQGQSLWLIGGAVVALLGLLFTAGVIKVPRALRV